MHSSYKCSLYIATELPMSKVSKQKQNYKSLLNLFLYICTCCDCGDKTHSLTSVGSHLTQSWMPLKTFQILSIDRSLGQSHDTHDSILAVFSQKLPSLALFQLFSSFQTNTQSLHQINVKNVDLVYGAKIQTHDLWNMSLLP